MKDLTKEIQNACNVSDAVNLKDYSKKIRSNLRSVKDLNGPGLYVQFWKMNSDVYDANGGSKSSHQKPKVVIVGSLTHGSVKPGSAQNGSGRVFDYIKQQNLPDKGYEGVQPNMNSKHFHNEEKTDWKGLSYYNMNEVYSKGLVFFGWIPTDSCRTAEELEKIWNNSVTDCLCNGFDKATYGSSKGTKSETNIMVDFTGINVEEIKNQIINTSLNKIEKLKVALTA